MDDRGFVREIGSCDCGGWGVPQHAIWELENQRNPSLKVWEAGKPLVSLSVWRRRLGTWGLQVQVLGSNCNVGPIVIFSLLLLCVKGCYVGSPSILVLAGGWRTWSSGEQEKRVPQLQEKQRIHLSSAFLFYLSPRSIGWCPPSLVRAGFIYSVHWPKYQSPPGNTLADTPRTYALLVIWASLNPVKLTPKINHHTLR